MKIFTSPQIRALDAYTIKHEPIASIDLMERASSAVYQWILERFSNEHKFMFFCGPGNNGGDGLAVARMLLQQSYVVEVYVVRSENYSSDFLKNEARLLELQKIIYLNEEEPLPEVGKGNVVVDAILGSGLNKSLTGFMATIVQMINASEALIISIDISSGLFAEKPMPDNSIAVRPDYTLTFQLPKLAFMFSENARFTGEWQLLDIGLHGEFMQNENTPYCFVDKEFIRTFYKSKREKFSHKNSYGKVLITAGSYGMMGAALLTAEACLRTGCGVLKAYIPKCGYDIFQTALPEAMTLTDDHFEYHTKLPDVTGFDVIGVGPGLAEGKDVKEVLKKLFKSVKCPLVLDAGALNLLAKHKDLLKMLPKGSVLTPHPGEFGRLAGAPVNDYDRLERLMKFSAETGCMVLLKGAHSAIASPDGKVYFNSTGTPGMATPGTGDALTGVITSLLAQGYPPLQSTILGAYIHGYAGERASEEFGDASMLASDLIGKIKDFYLDF